VNHATVTPFGGFKESGMGREGGVAGVLECTDTVTPSSSRIRSDIVHVDWTDEFTAARSSRTRA
jgi:hypothetical protein